MKANPISSWRRTPAAAAREEARRVADHLRRHASLGELLLTGQWRNLPAHSHQLAELVELGDRVHSHLHTPTRKAA